MLDWRPWALFFSYAIGAKLGLSLAIVHPSATAIWPATGIAIAGSLLLGRRAWPAVFAAAFLVNLTTTWHGGSSLAIAAGNTLEGALGAWAVEEFIGWEAGVTTPQGLLGFIAVSFGVSLVSAAVGVGSLVAWGLAPAASAMRVFGTWWLGDAVGAVIVAPTVLLWARWRREMMPGSWLEAAAVVLLRIATLAAVFNAQPGADKAGAVLAWPALVWSAFRLGPAPTATLLLAGAGWAAYYTARGFGPFAVGDPNTALLQIQLYMLVGTLTVLALAIETERRRATEDALRRANVMLAERIADHAHELRTPIAAIKGFAETLRLGAVEDRRRRLPFLRTIEKHADRLSRLVDRLLQLSRVEAGRWAPDPRPLALRSMVDDCVKGLAPLARRKNLDLGVEVPEDLSAFGDPEQVHIVMQNLLDNAIKYNREGGRIRVRAGRERENVKVEVLDTGLGIPADELPLLFTRFHRGRHRGEERGSGLGLAIVRGMVEANGGRVWVESREGSGSSFFVSLPAEAS